MTVDDFLQNLLGVLVGGIMLLATFLLIFGLVWYAGSLLREAL